MCLLRLFLTAFTAVHLLQWCLINVCNASRVMQDPHVQGSSDPLKCMRTGPAGVKPPLARRIHKELETAAGRVEDNFYWLRDDSRSDPHVLAYLSAENSYADTALQPLAALAGKLANEMESRLSNVTEPVPVRHGRWWYHEKQLPGQGYWLHYRSQATLLKHAGTTRDSSSSTDNGNNIQQKAVHSSSNKTSLRMSNRSSPSAVDHSTSSTNKHTKQGRNLLTRIHARISKGNHGKSALRPTSAGAAAAAAGSYSYDSWDSSAPDADAPVQVVLDPNRECAAAASGVDDTGSGSSTSTEHCDVFGATVSPDGALVAFGVDVSGSELYQLMVRNISSNKHLIMPMISGTSGDYEWAASSQGLFFITHNSTTNRPDKAWYVDLTTAQSVLLWQEDNAAFYLSLSRSSSARFLLLASASEVTRQVVLMDLEAQHKAGRAPTADDWLHLAPRQAGVQQQAVAHWQSWLFLLVVSPSTPNGELRAALVSHPRQHRVLLAHREEVELEDLRLFAHHLVLAERQLGHTTLTVYCLPANSSQAATAACRYNSTAASAAEAQAEEAAAAEVAAAAAEQSNRLQGPSSSHSAPSDHSAGSADKVNIRRPADVTLVAAAAAVEVEHSIMLRAGVAFPSDSSSSSKGAATAWAARDQQPVTDSVQLDIDETVTLLEATEPGSDDEAQARQESKTFLLIRGRAGSISDGNHGLSKVTASHADQAASKRLDPAVAVEEQRRQQQQQPALLEERRKGRASHQVSNLTGPDGNAGDRQQGAAAVDQDDRSSRPQHGAVTKQSNVKNRQSKLDGGQNKAKHGGQSKAKSNLQKLASAGGGAGSPAAPTANMPGTKGQQQEQLQHLPQLASDNSWQVAFEEDAYSVSILDSGDWASPYLRLSYTSFTTPHSIIDIDMLTQRRIVRSVARVGSGFRSEAYRSYRLWALAADGVSVPLSLVYRLDMFGRNGLNPALLMVYGAYGTKYDPEFDSRLLALLDRGWVVGIAHVRGGGELGYAWHAHGRLAAKLNSFTDLVACAQTLIAHNLTSPSRLAVWGRSAGALTAAAAINASPELFHAALLDVPFLDVLGDLVDVSLPLTVKEWEEWGDPLHSATMARVIRGYSPVHNVLPGVVYPHMMVTAGLMDKRVGYWEAAKWVAELRAQSHSGASAAAGQLHGHASPAAAGQRLLLLRTDMSGGHFSAGGSVSSIDEAALKYAFLMATLPSCGSPQGLTGPDADSTLAAGASSWAAAADKASQAVLYLQYLPPPVQHLLMMLFTVMVMFGLVGVVWQASKVWWPPAISPADLYDLVESEDIDISQLLPPVQARHTTGRAATLPVGSSKQQRSNLGREQAVVSSSSSSASSKVVRDIARRTSTAAAGDRLQQQCGEQAASQMVVSVSVSEGAAPDRHYCVASSGWHDGQQLGGCNNGSSGCSGAGSETNAGNTYAWPVVDLQQQQQQHLVLGCLTDDWLLELTSGVPRSCRPASTPQQQQQQQHSTGLSQCPHSLIDGHDGAGGAGGRLLSSNGSLGSNCSSSSSAVNFSSANGSRALMARRWSNGLQP